MTRLEAWCRRNRKLPYVLAHELELPQTLVYHLTYPGKRKNPLEQFPAQKLEIIAAYTGVTEGELVDDWFAGTKEEREWRAAQAAAAKRRPKAAVAS